MIFAAWALMGFNIGIFIGILLATNLQALPQRPRVHRIGRLER